jgi:hypothetical protein
MADKSPLLISLCMLGVMSAWLAGCATTPKIDWNSRVGAYSYDQAIIDLGPPDKMAKLSDDSTVAEWMTNRGRYYGSSASFGYYGSPYGRYGYYPGYLMSPQYLEKSPDTFLRLIFDPGGMLVNWTDFRK